MVFVRNVKFSAAECNSFNTRKKNIEDLASKMLSGGSHAKKQPSRCKVASFGVQSNTHHGAKLHPLECKVISFGVQSNTHHGAKLQLSECDSNFFGFNLAYLPTTNAPLPIKSQPSQNCIIIQFECIFMQFWALFTSSIC